MLDHLGLRVADHARSRAVLERPRAPRGVWGAVGVAKGEPRGRYQGCGFGPPQRPHFWIGTGTGGATSGSGAHIAFSATSRAAVDAFHAAALAAGGRDNGAPGLRPHYHADDYGAFVIDPDGHNIEAVCHLSEAATR